MQDRELYRYVLGLGQPGDVKRMEFNIKRQRIDIWAIHKEGVRRPCPEYGATLGIYDHSREREWRHLGTCKFKTFLPARVPRVRCQRHGVKQMRVSWAEVRSRFTALFERLAMDVKRGCDSLSASCLRISWDKAWRIMERTVERGLKAKKKRPRVKAWFFWATHSRPEPAIEKALMFRKYLKQILTCFRHRITNAVSEGLNSRVETIRRRAYGFRNRQHFKIAIYFYCGGLNLYPVTHTKVG